MRSRLAQLVVIGAVASLLLACATLAILRSVTESSSGELRRAVALRIAQTIERRPYEHSVQLLDALGVWLGLPRTPIWVMSRTGEVLATNAGPVPPPACGAVPSGMAVHEIAMAYGRFQINPDAVLVQLADPGDVLCMGTARNAATGWARMAPIALPILAALGSALLSVVFCFIYLRRKSHEASAVLTRLRHGELDARFCIRSFDAIGKLMLDFNRMGDEIERLITRLRQAERTRVDVLQQLSHDLRTPLMSLRMAADTLAQEAPRLTAGARGELLEVLRVELAYFSHVLDQLFVIACVEDAPEAMHRERVDLGPLVRSELDAAARRAAAAGRDLAWTVSAPAGAAWLDGDPALIRRLVRNALDNAARFAARQIELRLGADPEGWRIAVADDGPGMTAAQIAGFGKPSSTRSIGRDGAHDGAIYVSLGLGSVIIASIVTLHGGRWQISSPDPEAPDHRGTVLVLRLPRASAEPASRATALLVSAAIDE